MSCAALTPPVPLYLHRLRQEQMTAARAPGGSWRSPLRCIRIAYVQVGERQVLCLLGLHVAAVAVFSSTS